ncbi:type III-B CRISPR module-associated protein Cmr3 [Myxococcota bacterium]|nr:type III-B CRISPR module-associated protein Cmr3 [Myxococcota bacterium]MBU1898654.1 type III-B CRISPR module-associated protein Cmr3 [Myxococcota bacterium]
MKTWLLEPRDTLLVGDGRPAYAGSPMHTLPFPWPSSLAGLARTRAGLDAQGVFGMTPAEALQIEVCGPWLAELDSASDAVTRLLFPAPQDCVWHRHEDEKDSLTRYRLAPRAYEGLHDAELGELSMIGPTVALPEGKLRSGPRFWTWAMLRDWLAAPSNVYRPEPKTLTSQTVEALSVEARVHVALDPELRTASDGQLFATEGLRFHEARGEGFVKSWRRFGLVFACDDARLSRTQVVHLGGERRLSFMRPIEGAWPTRPDWQPRGRRLRLVLLTPGIFDAGFCPRDPEGGRIVAARVDRPEVVSGWDIHAGGPKPTRRMAPAGSVYWVELDEGVNAAAFVERYWMRSLSDQAQDQRDGFGICVVGEG